MNLDELVACFLKNFGFAMVILAIVMAMVVWKVRGRKSLGEELFRWTALLGAGVSGVYTAVGHVFFPERSAEEIGWATSPFQYEVGMADLTIGVLGIMAFWGNFGFRLAVAIGATIWYGGDAIGHVRQMIVAHNFAPGNAGSWFWMDILVPIILMTTVWFCRPRDGLPAHESPAGA